ncbi:hypothetical protein GZL_03837 [Streptomyces sp. 769]|nr:hypothetical protein GZL_03837 [Streptomyces sp. 769]
MGGGMGRHGVLRGDRSGVGRGPGVPRRAAPRRRVAAHRSLGVRSPYASRGCAPEV